MPDKRVSPFLNLAGVSFRYGNDEVLAGVNLTVGPGEYVGVVGPNGGGKSTLLKLMLGLIQPSAGTIKLFGAPTPKFRDWHRVGYVPQRVTEQALQFPATVEEVVLMGRLANRGLLHALTDHDHDHAHAALETVGLLPLADRLIGQLSGGELQRVLIARALAGEPELLILDEPTVGLQASVQAEFYKLLQKLSSGGRRTVILVSHDLSVVERDVTRIVEVNKTVRERTS